MIDLPLVHFLLFLLVSIHFFVMAAVFLCTKNGGLKIALVFFLACLGTASLLRMFSGRLVGTITPDGLGIAVALIVLTGQIALILWWWRKK